MPEGPRDPTRARELIATWLRGSKDEDLDSPAAEMITGLDVPRAAAQHVIDVTRRTIAEAVGLAAHPNAFSPTRPLAEALILDQHPSAHDWTVAERREVLDWLTLLIDELGEDGVTRVVGSLNDCP